MPPLIPSAVPGERGNNPVPAVVFCRKYELSQVAVLPNKHPAAHQNQLLSRLAAWYSDRNDEQRGTILVLPTGGGKTFTAVYFACRHPISEGYKVLWLAHTHHLLEQAFYTFDSLAPALVNNSHGVLTTRVVSGTVGHYRIHEVRPDDDVVIASLQSTHKAFQRVQQSLVQFLDSANGKLLVVFDEAHHAPAPSYRRLLQGLREFCPHLLLLGLTATPTHTDERKRGWLPKLFPQDLGYQVTPQELMAAGVLAKPHLEQQRTAFEPELSDEQFDEWLRKSGDLPEDIVTKLANTESRNRFICNHYANNRERFGKTIVFADRWEQCEFLCEYLMNRGVKAGAIYSHVAYLGATPEERNRRTRSTNDEVLDSFRKDELDVLVNIQMATEGVDIPDAKTVFLTRQTTSQILLTQMVGRALRGKRFGGTADAHIVAFIDDWKHRINWATYPATIGDPADDDVERPHKRPFIELISIDLIRRLAKQIDSGISAASGPFSSLLPAGWYATTFDTSATDSDDVDSRSQLVLIYEDERTCFERFVDFLCQETTPLMQFEEISTQLPDVRNEIESWKQRFFKSTDEGVGATRSSDLFAIARHIAQNERSSPRFFKFEERDNHDLDKLASAFIAARLDRQEEVQKLQTELNRDDRFWRSLFPNYGMFKCQYDAVCNRILNPGEDQNGKWENGEPPRDDEVPTDVKNAVLRRDNHRCLCCGEDKRSFLEVDHIEPKVFGGIHDLENLQTLCQKCNSLKATACINFRSSKSPLTEPPGRLPEFVPPREAASERVSSWGNALCRYINFFYKCSAVERMTITEHGTNLDELTKSEWSIDLAPALRTEWIAQHMAELRFQLQQELANVGYSPIPSRIHFRTAVDSE